MASFSVSCPKSLAGVSCGLQQQPSSQQQQQQSMVSYSLSSRPGPSVLAGSSLGQLSLARLQGHYQNYSTVWKAQIDEVAVEKSSNSTSISLAKFEVPSSDGSDVKPAAEPSCFDVTISTFMTEVASLVKLVDSRDIMELQLKQQDCELLIKKKDALPQLSATTPVVMLQPPSPQPMLPSRLPQVHAATAPPSSGPPAPASATTPVLPAPAKLSKSSHLPLKCPMAGTFYRCPAPGEPPFVKVGDKVQKGQVICIIEAMKLMNEIEADQSGTVIEILVEDGKPVSVDMPLFIIEP